MDEDVGQQEDRQERRVPISVSIKRRPSIDDVSGTVGNDAVINVGVRHLRNLILHLAVRYQHQPNDDAVH